MNISIRLKNECPDPVYYNFRISSMFISSGDEHKIYYGPVGSNQYSSYYDFNLGYTSILFTGWYDSVDLVVSNGIDVRGGSFDGELFENYPNEYRPNYTVAVSYRIRTSDHSKVEYYYMDNSSANVFALVYYNHNYTSYCDNDWHYQDASWFTNQVSNVSVTYTVQSNILEHYTNGQKYFVFKLTNN